MQSRRASPGIVPFLIEYIRPYKSLLAMMAASLGVGIATRLWSPQFIKKIIDAAVSRQNSDIIVAFAIQFLAIILLEQISSIITDYLGARIGLDATNRLREKLVAHCLHLPLPFYRKHTPGEMIERIDGDISHMSEFFSDFVVNIAGNLLVVTGVLIIMIVTDSRMALILILYTLSSGVVLMTLPRWSLPAWFRTRTAAGAFFGFVEERIAAREDLAANGASAHVLAGLNPHIIAMRQADRKAYWTGHTVWVATHGLFIAATTAILAHGGWRVMHGLMSIGTLYVVLHYARYLYGPLDQIKNRIGEMQKAAAGLSRVKAILEMEQEETPAAASERLNSRTAAVRFERVWFSYDESGPSVLQNIDFSLEQGSRLGIVGKTGGGKSTIARLLLRLYASQSGRILLDGKPLNAFDPVYLRQRIAYAPQEVQLFSGTIRDNIALYNKAIDDSAILEAAHRLGIRAWIESLPQGLGTVLGGGERSLSAGEAQLIALARAIVKEPVVVILDEATARLDQVTEKLVAGATRALTEGRTTLIIAHRLATIAQVQTVMVLDAGKIVEYDSPAVLLKRADSVFASIVNAHGAFTRGEGRA